MLFAWLAWHVRRGCCCWEATVLAGIIRVLPLVGLHWCRASPPETGRFEKNKVPNLSSPRDILEHSSVHTNASGKCLEKSLGSSPGKSPVCYKKYRPSG